MANPSTSPRGREAMNSENQQLLFWPKRAQSHLLLPKMDAIKYTFIYYDIVTH